MRPKVSLGGEGQGGERRGQPGDEHRDGEARAYARGSASKTLDALSDPALCRETLLASTSVGPVESRLRL